MILKYMLDGGGVGYQTPCCSFYGGGMDRAPWSLFILGRLALLILLIYFLA